MGNYRPLCTHCGGTGYEEPKAQLDDKDQPFRDWARETKGMERAKAHLQGGRRLSTVPCRKQNRERLPRVPRRRHETASGAGRSIQARRYLFDPHRVYLDRATGASAMKTYRCEGAKCAESVHLQDNEYPEEALCPKCRKVKDSVDRLEVMAYQDGRKVASKLGPFREPLIRSIVAAVLFKRLLARFRDGLLEW